MWQNLVLSFIAGWVVRSTVQPITRRVRAGQPVKDAITNRSERARRRIPRPTEMP